MGGTPKACTPSRARSDASFSKGTGLACPVDVPKKMAAGRGFAPRLILIQSQGDYCCRAGNPDTGGIAPHPACTGRFVFETVLLTFGVQCPKWWAATVMLRASRFKRPLHHFNACDPNKMEEMDPDGGSAPPSSVYETDVLLLNQSGFYKCPARELHPDDKFRRLACWLLHQRDE